MIRTTHWSASRAHTCRLWFRGGTQGKIGRAQAKLEKAREAAPALREAERALLSFERSCCGASRPCYGATRMERHGARGGPPPQSHSKGTASISECASREDTERQQRSSNETHAVCPWTREPAQYGCVVRSSRLQVRLYGICSLLFVIMLVVL